MISPAAAKGLISRWVNVESSGGPTASNNLSGGHWGIAQWDHTRAGKLFGNGDFDAQLALVRKEATNPDYSNRLHNAKTDVEGATAASNFERSDGYNRSTGTDHYTSRTLGGMQGLDEVIKRGRGASAPSIWNGTGGGAGSIAPNPSVINGGATHHSSTETHVHIANLTVHTAASDAHGVARSIAGELRRTMSGGTANFGLA